MTCRFTPWRFVFAGVERPVIPRGHADPVDREQGAIEDDVGLAAGQVERFVEGRGNGGEDIDTFTDVAEHGCGADTETAGQRGVGLALVQVC
jgi:hypothetical protein